MIQKSENGKIPVSTKFESLLNYGFWIQESSIPLQKSKNGSAVINFKADSFVTDIDIIFESLIYETLRKQSCSTLTQWNEAEN